MTHEHCPSESTTAMHNKIKLALLWDIRLFTTILYYYIHNDSNHNYTLLTLFLPQHSE